MSAKETSAFGFTLAEANLGYGKFNDPNSQWNRLQQNLFQKITTMATEIPLIETKIKKLGTPEERKEDKDKILNQLSVMRQTANEISLSLKEISTMLKETKDKRLMKERTQKVEKIKVDFQGWLNKLKDVSQAWVNTQKKAQELEASKNANYGSKIKNFFTSKFQKDETTPLLQQELMMLENEIDYYDAVILEREKGIREVEKNILQVNEMYLELGTLISTQGDTITSIEEMIENSKEEVNIGVDYLESAVGHQKSANHKVYLVALLCFIIITFLCGLVFVVVKVIP